ncbi:MAG: DegT/DnrJ/EryC1/StrS family aminotransferase, partial [Verrucomicrobiaceae bacterium]
PLPLDRQPCYRFIPVPAPLPAAHRLAEEVLSIPVYPELTASQQEEVAIAVTEWLRQPA